MDLTKEGSDRWLPFLSIPLGELDFLGHLTRGQYVKVVWLSIPLGELDFLGLPLPIGRVSIHRLLSIPLGELDFLGRNIIRDAAIKGNTFQFPLGN